MVRVDPEVVRLQPLLADTYWKSLTFFNVYRLIVGLVLAGTMALPRRFLPDVEGLDPSGFLRVSLAYLVACALSLVVVLRFRRRFNWQLMAQVVVDVVAFSLLIYYSGGLRSGVGVMLLVTVAGAGLVGQGRLVLFFAALASIGVLLQQSFYGLATELLAADFFLAGVLSVGFFGMAGTSSLLARRVIANEELARQRGEALRRQMQVSEQVISLMQDGVLVVTSTGFLLQVNPRARELLAPDSVGGDQLSAVAPFLAKRFEEWLQGWAPSECELRGAGGRLLLARFVPVSEDARDYMIFLSDVGEQREAAQRAKLAALGRLTANIAHEIRNPLSAIQHAAELLREERRSEGEERLLHILLENTRRLEGMVSDVLKLGRRDRVHRERILVEDFLESLVEQLLGAAHLPPTVVTFDVAPGAVIHFDRAHLHQVVWNLLSNALRYCRGEPGSLGVQVHTAGGETSIDIFDDGPGISDDARGQIFEPFFTTHPKGTGLGLYIARELAEANGARVSFVDNAPGAHFRVTGGSES